VGAQVSLSCSGHKVERYRNTWHIPSKKARNVWRLPVTAYGWGDLQACECEWLLEVLLVSSVRLWVAHAGGHNWVIWRLAVTAYGLHRFPCGMYASGSGALVQLRGQVVLLSSMRLWVAHAGEHTGYQLTLARNTVNDYEQ
jgi:hypothetical protein